VVGRGGLTASSFPSAHHLGSSASSMLLPCGESGICYSLSKWIVGGYLASFPLPAQETLALRLAFQLFPLGGASVDISGAALSNKTCYTIFCFVAGLASPSLCFVGNIVEDTIFRPASVLRVILQPSILPVGLSVGSMF
jgi:hypothetical protein